MRSNLVLIPVGTDPVPDLFSLDREYDVLWCRYREDSAEAPEAECGCTSVGTEKLHFAAKALPLLLDRYNQFALLDDDLHVTAKQLNRLFQVAGALDLDLYQPSLTLSSTCAHECLYTKGRAGEPVQSLVRLVPWVEIMCPFFSRRGLELCLPTFMDNESGYGLDLYAWPKLVVPYVIEVPIGHYRKSDPVRNTRKLKNGLTLQEDLKSVYEKWRRYEV